MDACDAGCRAIALTAVLRYRGSGERIFETESLAKEIAPAFAARWPKGLAIPNPDIPNRDPFAEPMAATAPPNITPAFDPLAPRAPLEIWRADDELLARRFVLGLAIMIPDRDVREFDAALRRVAPADPHLDSALALAAIAEAARPRAPFDGAQILASLNRSFEGKGGIPCCADESKMAEAKADQPTLEALSGNGAVFANTCAPCHRTPEVSPPNFLWGDEAHVTAALHQCAPRMFARLSMWRVPSNERAKTPMPPARASQHGEPSVQTEPDPSIAELTREVARWLRDETGEEPDISAMLAGGYERLRSCLPGSA
jgi:hypothetical protein